ncbi:Dual specificity protein phosphatase 10 [Entomortierella beljakovae]|nr:Dual specificity protein phosphatase 10 [Entomortierella beljakovae]
MTSYSISQPESTTSVSPPIPMVRPTSHSFSLQQPSLSEAKKTRNAKRLSLLVPPSPGKLEALASIAAATPTITTPSFPPTPSFSARRRFTSAPLSTSLSTIPSQSPAGTPTTEEYSIAETTTRRQNQIMLDNVPPTPCIPLSVNNQKPAKQRPISAYFADFSVERGTASPYTAAPVCILEHLFLGAEHNALDHNILTRLGVTAVLNVAVEITTASQQQQHQSDVNSLLPSGDRIVKTIRGKTIRYKNLSWTHNQGNLLSEFPEAFAFIEETKNKGGKVLVHCQLGVSRSASLVIAYVMKSMQMNLTDAYDFVKARSSVISPNMSLMYQLAEFGKSLNKSAISTITASSQSKDTSNWASAREDDEDEYPYPTEMEIDEAESKPQAPAEATHVKPSLHLSSSAGFNRPRSNCNRGPAIFTGDLPKTPMVSHFSFPEKGLSTVPSTPLTGRFPSFSDRGPVPPPTPMKDSFTFSDIPNTPTTNSMSTRSRLRFPDGISLNSSKESIDSIELSLPTPLFKMTQRPSFSSSSTSVSSFATDSSLHSRPSSASSVSSASLSVCEVSAPMKFTSNKEANTGHWSKLPSPLTTAQPQNDAVTGTKNTHALAKALGSRWPNGFQGQQQQQQPMMQANGIECLISSDITMEDFEYETNVNDTVKKELCNPPEFIFSPRPNSPSVLETSQSFGDVYQALQME